MNLGCVSGHLFSPFHHIIRTMRIIPLSICDLLVDRFRLSINTNGEVFFSSPMEAYKKNLGYTDGSSSHTGGLVKPISCVLALESMQVSEACLFTRSYSISD